MENDILSLLSFGFYTPRRQMLFEKNVEDREKRKAKDMQVPLLSSS